MIESRVFGCVTLKSRWGLSGRGWLALFLGMVISLGYLVATIHPFLAVSHPVRGDILVVEGWLPDGALQQAMRDFDSHDYRLLITTGGPLEKGSYLIRHHSYAELAAATMIRLGVDPRHIAAVPALYVRKDRTYASALALRKWLKESKITIHSIDLLTLGTHARRSWLLYEQGLPPSIQVGIISVEDSSYDPDRWWQSGAGVRSVIGETIAYIYAQT